MQVLQLESATPRPHQALNASSAAPRTGLKSAHAVNLGSERRLGPELDSDLIVQLKNAQELADSRLEKLKEVQAEAAAVKKVKNWMQI